MLFVMTDVQKKIHNDVTNGESTDIKDAVLVRFQKKFYLIIQHVSIGEAFHSAEVIKC